MKDLHILHLSGSKHHWSGNEQQLADLIRHLGDMGVQSSIFCYEGSSIQQYALEHDIPTLPQPRQSVYSSGLRQALRQAVRTGQYDIIHVHTSNYLTLYVLTDLLGSLGMPTVFSRKGLTDKASYLSRKKYNYKGIDRIICVSGAVRDNFCQYLTPSNHAKAVVVHDGISTDTVIPSEGAPSLCEAYALPQGRFVIGNIANHVGDKDLETLVRTADYLVNTLGRKEALFVQMGDHTDLTPALVEGIRAAGLEDHVRLLGKVAGAKAYMKDFDLFLMTSRSEGLPLTVYEAFLYGTPVVTTCAGGIPEAVTDGHSGVMTAIGDHIALAQGIERMMQNPALRQEIARNAHALLLEKFTARQCAERTLGLYQDILKP